MAALSRCLSSYQIFYEGLVWQMKSVRASNPDPNQLETLWNGYNVSALILQLFIYRTLRRHHKSWQDCQYASYQDTRKPKTCTRNLGKFTVHYLIIQNSFYLPSLCPITCLCTKSDAWGVDRQKKMSIYLWPLSEKIWRDQDASPSLLALSLYPSIEEI